MDLSFKNQTAVLYDKVNYKSNLSKLSADKILVTLYRDGKKKTTDVIFD